MREFYIVTSTINILALLIMVYIIHKSNVIDQRERLFFQLSIFVTVFVIAAEILTVYFDGAHPTHRLLCVIGNMAGFSMSPVIPLLLGCMISDRFQKLDWLFGLPALINLILSLLSAVFPFIFTVSADNVYQRGEFFWVFTAAYALSTLYLFFQTLNASKRYQNSNRFVLFALFLFMLLGTSVQVLRPSLHVSWLCISMSICLYYVYYSELRHQIDGLTWLLTRRTYEESLNKIRGRKNVTFFIFDIDNFKCINDRYGHPFGDFCIKSTANCIKDVFSKNGLCFRTGGDEFCVISDCVDTDTVQSLYQKFLSEINLMRKENPSLPMVSIGYASYNKKSGTIGEAIFNADQQMYCFKQSRKHAPPSTVNQ
ncbi:MAG: GGDEF domain-containing protein [Oscillospiraceae bacterium]|jgi:diguanylate cyclase (GGDEF)-like protein